MIDFSVHKVSSFNFIALYRVFFFQKFTILHTVNFHARDWEISKTQRECAIAEILWSSSRLPEITKF